MSLSEETIKEMLNIEAITAILVIWVGVGIIYYYLHHIETKKRIKAGRL